MLNSGGVHFETRVQAVQWAEAERLELLTREPAGVIRQARASMLAEPRRKTEMGFEDMEWPALVEYVAGRGPSQHAAAIIEAQRRAVETQERLIVAIETSGDCSSQQTAEVIKLTNALRVLTWVLIGVGVIQIGIMLFKG